MRRPFLVIIFLISIAGLIFSLVWPAKKKLDQVWADISVKKLEIQSRQEYFRNLENTSQRLADYSAQTKKINSALPSREEFPVLYDYLLKIIPQSGLLISSLNPAFNQSEKKEKIVSHRFDLSVSGSYSSFRNLLSVLENSSRLFEIKNISFGQKEDSQIFNLGIEVRSY